MQSGSVGSSVRARAARSVALLWRVEPERAVPGPKPSLGLDAVVRAAVKLADRKGLEALSIRAVAGKLRVSPMSVYTYVPTKADLLTLMVDHVLLHMERTPHGRKGWRARVTSVAEDNRRLQEAHPWLVNVPPNRPSLGPGTLAKYEHELHALDDTGLDDVTRDLALTHVLGFVESWAHARLRTLNAVRTSGMDDAAWWEAQGPALARVAPLEQFPLAGRVGAASAQAQGTAYNPDHVFRFGLECVLSALEGLVSRATPRR